MPTRLPLAFSRAGAVEGDAALGPRAVAARRRRRRGRPSGGPHRAPPRRRRRVHSGCAILGTKRIWRGQQRAHASEHDRSAFRARHTPLAYARGVECAPSRPARAARRAVRDPRHGRAPDHLERRPTASRQFALQIHRPPRRRSPRRRRRRRLFRARVRFRLNLVTFVTRRKRTRRERRR